MTQFDMTQLLSAVNAAGFESEQELQDWIKVGRLLVADNALSVSNALLDAQTAAVSQQHEQAKQANNAERAQLQSEIAAIVAA